MAMIGYIHRFLFSLLESTGGVEALAEIKLHAGVPEDRHFAMNEVYCDEKWQSLLKATSEVLGPTQDEAEEAFADYFCEDALATWPACLQTSMTAPDLLEKRPAIHNRFASGLRDPEKRATIESKFRPDTSDEKLVLHYLSPNRFCSFYKRATQSILDHYREHAVIEEHHCLKRGDLKCDIGTTWT